MTVSDILSKSYRITNTNATTFLNGTEADVLSDLNDAYGQRILDILKVRTDINASINEAKTDLISTTGLEAGDTGYEGEYAFPTDLLRPTRVEISYDGDSWNKAQVYDLNENNQSEVEPIEFSTANPYVRFERDSYFIRPLPTTSVTGGIRVWYEQRQTDLTTDSPTFEANLHDILAYDLAEQEVLMHADKYTPAWMNRFDKKKREVEDRFMDFYKNRFKRSFKLKSKTESYK